MKKIRYSHPYVPHCISGDYPVIIPNMIKYSEAKQERIEARLSSEQKALIQQAADLEGRSLTDFVIQNAHLAALKVIQDNTFIKLASEDSKQLVQMLMHPAEPTEELKSAAEAFKKSGIRTQWQN